MGLLLVLGAMVAAFNPGGVRDRMLGRPVPGQIESIAVLPLVNLSHDPEQEYFADGMTEELTASLSRITALRVISRTSAMHYKGTDKPLPKIAGELHVDAIIEGSILRAGDRVRITAQLVEAASDRHLWAESYERDLRDVLTLQDQVARAIADEVRAKVSPGEQERLRGRRPVDPVAYDAYLKGLHLQESSASEAEMQKSLGYFEQAIERDPGDALSHAALAGSYVFLTSIESLPHAEGMGKAKALSLKALEIDDSLSEAHETLGEVLENEWDWSGAEREYQRAIELDTNNALARIEYGGMLANLGRSAEAEAQRELAVKLDPLSPHVLTTSGGILATDRKYDLALQEYRKAVEIDPRNAAGHFYIASCYMLEGKHEEAISEARQAVDLSGQEGSFLAGLALAYAMAGEKDEARRQLEELLHQADKKRFQLEIVAAVFLALGDKDHAFEWLERAYANHSGALGGLKRSWLADRVRSDPRFEDLMRRVGLPPD